MRKSVHHDLYRNRNLLFDFFGCTARPLRDDVDIVIGNVRIGFDGKITERNDAPNEQENGDCQYQQTIVQGEVNESANHCRYERVKAPRFQSTEPGGQLPCIIRRLALSLLARSSGYISTWESDRRAMIRKTLSGGNSNDDILKTLCYRPRRARPQDKERSRMHDRNADTRPSAREPICLDDVFPRFLLLALVRLPQRART